MTNTTSTRGRMSRLLVAGAATAALAVGALAATAAPASAAAALSASQTTDLVYAGQQVTVKGSGYTAGTTLYVTVCDTTQLPGMACDFNPANFAEATVDSSGKFSASITAMGSFAATDCLAGGTACAITTSNKNNPGDIGSYATLPISFAHLSLSKTTLKVGDTVTLTGTHYPAAPGTLWVSVCLDPPAANNCNMNIAGGEVGQLNYDGSGSFTTTYTLKSSSFASGVGTVDCAKVQCVIGTSNQNPMLTQYNHTAKFVVSAAPGKAKINKLKVKKNDDVVVKWKAASAANGAPVTGYTVQVKKAKKDWKKAGTTNPGKHKLVWKKGKDGKSYKFRVVAKSAAGNSKSKASKITI